MFQHAAATKLINPSPIHHSAKPLNLTTATLFILASALLTTATSAQAEQAIIGKNGVIAYTWNSNAEADFANLGKSRYTFNYDRPVSRKRLSSGVYQVNFDGLSCERGQFTVNAYGGAEFKSCRIGSWHGEQNCEVSVYCFDAKGQPYDSQFNLMFVD